MIIPSIIKRPYLSNDLFLLSIGSGICLCLFKVGDYQVTFDWKSSCTKTCNDMRKLVSKIEHFGNKY